MVSLSHCLIHHYQTTDNNMQYAYCCFLCTFSLGPKDCTKMKINVFVEWKAAIVLLLAEGKTRCQVISVRADTSAVGMM